MEFLARLSDAQIKYLAHIKNGRWIEKTRYKLKFNRIYGGGGGVGDHVESWVVK